MPEKMKRRKQQFSKLFLVVALLGGAYGAYHFLYASQRVSTENAYVGADIAPIAARIDGAVAHVAVTEGQQVQAGDVLVQLDKEEYALAVEAAAAALDQARQQVAEARLQSSVLQATIAQRQAQRDIALTEKERAESLYQKRSGSLQALQQAAEALNSAEAALSAAKAAYEANQISAGTGAVDDQPAVKTALTAAAQAALNLSRTTIKAPIAGMVAKRNVQVGQVVSIGASLMAVVPLDALYVDANFKESQLRDVKVGQEAELESDIYGSKVVYHAKVAAIGGGTGAAFALLPAQNATGNWIKVIQRVPVRLALDPAALQEHPLRVGMSMTATIKLP